MLDRKIKSANLIRSTRIRRCKNRCDVVGLGGDWWYYRGRRCSNWVADHHSGTRGGLTLARLGSEGMRGWPMVVEGFYLSHVLSYWLLHLLVVLCRIAIDALRALCWCWIDERADCRIALAHAANQNPIKCLTLEILQDAIRWWHHHFHHSPYYIQYHHTAVIITGKWVTTTTRHIHCSASLATIIRLMAVSSSNDVLSSSCHIITGKTQFGIIGIAPKNASLSQFLIFGIQCHRPWNDWSELIGFQSCT